MPKNIIHLLITTAISICSCVPNKTENPPTKKAQPQKTTFISQINEPWALRAHTRHQYYDFNSDRCYTMDDTTSLTPSTIHILSLDTKEKLEHFYGIADECINLEALQVVHIPMQTTELEQLFTVLAVKRHLKKLILYNCQIKILPPSISQLVHLETLDLSINQLTTLPPEVTTLPKLSYLDVGSNESFTHFPESLCDLPNLQRLEFKNTAVRSLSESIGNCKALICIKANAGKLTIIPDAIGQCINLRSLGLGYNNISQLPEGFGGLQNLQILSISGNKLQRLPESFSQLFSLKKIHIYDNQLTEFPLALTELSTLESIMIHKNNFTHLPEEIGKLTRLDWFRVDDDKIPKSEIHKIKNLLPQARINEHE